MCMFVQLHINNIYVFNKWNKAMEVDSKEVFSIVAFSKVKASDTIKLKMRIYLQSKSENTNVGIMDTTFREMVTSRE